MVQRWVVVIVIAGMAVGARPVAGSSTGASKTSAVHSGKPSSKVVDGITYADQPKLLFLPVSEASAALYWPVHWNRKRHALFVRGTQLSGVKVLLLPNGEPTLALSGLEKWGLTVQWNEARGTAVVTRKGVRLEVRRGEKRVIVNRAHQRLHAWQGQRLLLDTRVSTGMPGDPTPLGSFRAGLKRRVVIDHKFDNVPLYWTIQVKGDVLIHGFPRVPPHAASHGCIRVPMGGRNPARWLYFWVERGTRIAVTDAWPAPDRRR